MPDETDVSRDDLGTEAPTPVDNASGTESSRGSDDQPGGGETPLWQELGYETPDQLKSTHARYKQQLRGSAQEAKRLRDEADRYKREADEWRARSQPQQPTTPQPRQFNNLQEAYDAYLDGDATALARYDASQETRIQNAVLSTLSTAVRPNQYSDMVVSEFADLSKPDSALYAAVYDAYDAYASDPRWKLMYSDDPLAVREAHAPDGVGSKKVDMRIVYQLANKLSAQIAREEGRKEEAQRRAAAGGSTRGGGRTSDVTPDPWNQISASEQRAIDDLVTRGITPPGWPQVQDHSKRKLAFARHIVERRHKRSVA